jgi:hypothetical protein
VPIRHPRHDNKQFDGEGTSFPTFSIMLDLLTISYEFSFWSGSITIFGRSFWMRVVKSAISYIESWKFGLFLSISKWDSCSLVLHGEKAYVHICICCHNEQGLEHMEWRWELAKPWSSSVGDVLLEGLEAGFMQ